MKKLVLAAAIGLFSLPAMAQQMTVNAGRTTFGLRAGVNFNTLNGEDEDGDNLENKIATGFHAGLNAEIPVGSGFYVQPGVLYSLKGAEIDNNNNDKIRLSYVEVPLNLIYKPILGTGNMILGFGPYVAFGVDGKYDIGNTETEIDFVGEYEPSNLSPQFRRLDGGANFLAGYEFANKLSFQVNAQLGLVNILPENFPSGDAKVKNTGFGLSLGYRF